MWQPEWGWGGVICERMNTCICMAESLHYSPETITTLLIAYALMQKKNIFLKASHINMSIYLSIYLSLYHPSVYYLPICLPTHPFI